MSKKIFLRGTFLLTSAGFISRIIGFFYRIFLSHTIGAQGIGLYQLTFPLQSLILSLTTIGIQTALSRLISARLAVRKEKEAAAFFLAGTSTAFILSCLFSFLLFRYADFFSIKILKESSTAPLIKILCFCFPFASLHSCANSYCLALGKAEFPAFTQLLEQFVRVGSSWIFCQIAVSRGITVTAAVAAGGSLCSELVAALFSLLYISIRLRGFKYYFSAVKIFPVMQEISVTAFPMTLNRLLITLLGSIETVLIPQRLRMFGLSHADSLSIYGIFAGMALPLIMFPTALTNSAALMLMPSVSEMQALGNNRKIRRTIGQTSRSCALIGVFCCLFFFIFGSFMGCFLFHSSTAGIYIQTLAFICPFLYMNTALSAILHGLGKTGRCLIHNSIGILCRISCVFFVIPLAGMRGYLYGFLFSEMLLSLLHIYALNHSTRASESFIISR